jgi:hypothetical protein
MERVSVSLNFMPAFYTKHLGLAYGEPYYFDPGCRAHVDPAEVPCLCEVLGQCGVGSEAPQPSGTIVPGMPFENYQYMLDVHHEFCENSKGVETSASLLGNRERGKGENAKSCMNRQAARPFAGQQELHPFSRFRLFVFSLSL